MATSTTPLVITARSVPSGIVAGSVTRSAARVSVAPADQADSAQYQRWKIARTARLRQWASSAVTGQGQGATACPDAVRSIVASAASAERASPAQGQRAPSSAAAPAAAVTSIAGAGCTS